MAIWRFKDYLTEDRRSPILEWYGTLPEEAQVEFDLLVKVLSETEDWDEVKPTKRKYKELTRQHAGLCELKFKLASESSGHLVSCFGRLGNSYS